MKIFQSTCIYKATYSRKNKTLTITFVRDKSVYTWYYVPYDLYLKMITDESPGRVYNEEIKGHVFKPD